MNGTRLAAAATIVLWLATPSQAGDAGSRAAWVATPPPRSLKVAAVQFRFCRDLDRNVAGITARIVAPDGNIVQEASIFADEVVTADLDLRKATAGNALKSVTSGPLTDWWKEGVVQRGKIAGS